MSAANEQIQESDLDYIADCRAAFLEEKMPYAKILLIAIAAFIIAFLIWASKAEVSEITRGHGKIIPSGSTQIAQSLEGGIISEVFVTEGQIVEKGEELVRIDDTAFSATYRESLAERYTLLATIARLDAEAKDANTVTFPDQIINERPDLVETEMLHYEARRNKLLIEEQHLTKSLALKREELGITKPLAENGVVSRIEIIRLESATNDIDGNLKKVRTEYMSDVVAQRNEALSKLEQLDESLHAYQDKVKRTIIRSPVYGSINNVHIKTVGGIVQPGAPIVEIVPLDGNFMVEANISPADIAFISPHQRATVKLTAYDYSIYGGLDGTVEHISADTFTNEDGESYYHIKVRTGSRSLRNNEAELSIIPGMVCEVDITTGKKSILDYLLKPLLRAKMNAFSER